MSETICLKDYLNVIVAYNIHKNPTGKMVTINM